MPFVVLAAMPGHPKALRFPLRTRRGSQKKSPPGVIDPRANRIVTGVLGWQTGPEIGAG